MNPVDSSSKMTQQRQAGLSLQHLTMTTVEKTATDTKIQTHPYPQTLPTNTPNTPPPLINVPSPNPNPKSLAALTTKQKLPPPNPNLYLSTRNTLPASHLPS